MPTRNSDLYTARLRAVLERIRKAAQAAGRAPEHVALLAAAKGHPASAIEALARAGQGLFGESYLQEALKKRNQVTLAGLEWHFIGPIQSNKTRSIAAEFDWVQSVDREKILKRLDAQRPAGLAPLNICLQVNVSGEDSKSGVRPAGLAALAEAALACSRLKLRGLMAIPAPTRDAAAQRAAFAEVRELFELLKSRGHGLDTLSMGMSDDLEAAIAEGSTLVRVGTALFGPRA